MDHDLFTYPTHAGWKEATTSRDAAIGIEASGKAASLMERCLKAFHNGFVGNADELARHLGEDILSIRPRVTQLHVNGLIEKTGERRTMNGGRAGHVWRLA